ncbi:M81 family metallopeptidase [Roseovarius nubinhibens]|uniref:M81 family metallopeptidase n=1 Tax=Roseovarius nubinhibens TaxID=314263 RepID=UPI001C091ECD|nr:M81 family metallopeptidase [Roseovarius nubinhibens]
MRLFMAMLSTETNTFSPMPTGLSGFEDFYLRHGTATQDPPNLMTEALHLWRAKAEALGWEVVESLAAIAEPAGLTVAGTYDRLKAEILGDLTAAGGADFILLQLHGAMVAEHVEDCEGDLLQAIRGLCPDAIIGVALDLHCHLTERMRAASDLMICFKEYPHDDATPRAEELFDMALRLSRRDIQPVMHIHDCKMLGLFLTKQGEMQNVVQEMHALERQPGILSVSLSHGFPWADVADVGARVLVITDADPELARRVAEQFGRSFVARRDAVTTDYPSIETVLGQLTPQGAAPVVLADMGDNSGAGAPGDATFLLRAMLEHGFDNFASGLFWDPIAVRLCQDAGEGAQLQLRIGGKLGRESGQPLDIEAKVMAIRSGLGQHLGPGLEPLGTMVWLKLAGDIDLVINDLRTQVYHPEAFEQLGIDLARKSVVAVKSTFHFYAPFARIASKVIQIGSPGGSCPDFGRFTYTRGGQDCWPQVSEAWE